MPAVFEQAPSPEDQTAIVRPYALIYRPDLLNVLLEAARKSDLQRQVWASELAEEVRMSLVATAECLAGVPAYWLHRLSSVVGAVLVPVDRVLRHAARTFTPGDYDVAMSGSGRSSTAGSTVS